MDLINVTQARNNLSKLISEVYRRKKKFLLIRDSIPQAVLMSYDEFQNREEQWQDEVKEMMKQGREKLKKYLSSKGKEWPKDEKKVYEIIDQATGRS